MNDEKNLNEENNEEVSADTVTEDIEAIEEDSVKEETIAEEIETEEETESAADAQEETVGNFIASDSAQSALGNNSNDISDGLTGEAEAVDVEGIVIDEESDFEKKEVKKISAAAIAIIAVAVAVVIAIVVLLSVFGPKWFNKYNRKGYIDVTGKTVEEIADLAGMDLKEFLEEYDLPKDMPGDTSETTAFYTMPFKTAAEKVFGSDAETLKEQMNIEEDVDNTPYIEVVDKVPLKYMIDERRFDSFKEKYGFGDDVTLDTLWGEVRQRIDEKDMADRLAEEEAENADSENQSDDSSNE